MKRSSRPSPPFAALVSCAALLLLTLAHALPASAQSFSTRDKEHARIMLKFVKEDIRKHYYDPGLRGLDIEALYKAADEKINQATSNGHAFGIIAQFMLELKDSHTFFIPPQRAARVDYGWRMQMIGDECYVLAVKPGSDAEVKGLMPGDLIHVMDGYKPTRENMWQLRYLYQTLQPRAQVRLVVQSPGGQPRQLELATKVMQGKKQLDLSQAGFDFYELLRDYEESEHVYSHRHHELGEELFIWKMPQFDLSKEKVDEIMAKARKSRALILDLRGNSGGYVDTLLRLIGNLFDRDVTVGQVKRRKETEPLIARTRGSDVFKGRLVVLVDNGSASSSEVLARVVQLEKRGAVVGDRTAGAVMRSRGYGHQIGVDTAIFYAASVTDADVVMMDGKSLESVGVTPDQFALPTGAALRTMQDPVLSFAAGMLGVKLDPEKAGTLFPPRWKM